MNPNRVRLTLYPLGLLALAALVAMTFALAVLIPTLNPPWPDVQLLILLMSASGSVTIGLAYLLYHRKLLLWFRSLRWTLLATIGLTVGLIFLNVWVTAQLMFISEHDLVLTTALLVFAGVMAAISVFVIANSLVERIYALAQAAERVGQGDLRTRLEVAGRDELARLAQSFNLMASDLQAAEKQKQQLEQTRRDLIAWVSHDLRTPLAAIRAMNEAILDGVASDPATITRYTATIQKEVLHLSQLIDDLFEMARLDTGHVQLQRERVALRDLISDTLGGPAAQAARDQIDLRGQVEAAVGMVWVAPDKIQRVLYNLLDNALRHTPQGGQVTVTARQRGDQVEVSVRNTGAVIASADLPHLFKSFYRGEPSRAQGKHGERGAGLGLAIARGLVEAHGGQIWVESDAARGTTFTFTLPPG